MANFVYSKAKQSLLKGEINTNSSNYRVALLNKNNYTPNALTDQYLSQIPENAIVGISDNLSNITNINGVLDANDVAISHNGTAFDSLVFYQVGSSNANSILLFYLDDSPGLPFTGTNSSLTITIHWSNSATKILAL